MKYVSIDIETTGLDPETCQVLEVGAVVADSANIVPDHVGMPGFHCRIKHQMLYGEPVALAMNAELIRSIEQDYRHPEQNKQGMICLPAQAATEFAAFLADQFGQEGENVQHQDGTPRSGQGHVLVYPAGKNFSGFDKMFIQRLPGWNSPSRREIRFHHRVLDPTMLWFDPKFDSELPSLDVCLQRAGINTAVTHHAVQDAVDVIRALEAAWQGVVPVDALPSGEARWQGFWRQS